MDYFVEWSPWQSGFLAGRYCWSEGMIHASGRMRWRGWQQCWKCFRLDSGYGHAIKGDYGRNYGCWWDPAICCPGWMTLELVLWEAETCRERVVRAKWTLIKYTSDTIELKANEWMISYVIRRIFLRVFLWSDTLMGNGIPLPCHMVLLTDTANFGTVTTTR